MLDWLQYLQLTVFGWIAWVLAMMLCVVFFVMVRKGRWIAWEHPVCAACKFDLRGLPETSTRCPECGGELERVKKTGSMRKRWAARFVGVILLLLCLSLVVSPWSMIARLKLEMLPSWALMPFSNYRRVAGILVERLEDGELSHWQEERIIKTFLTRPQYYSLDVERLRALGHVPDSCWKDYAALIIHPNIEARWTVTKGDPFVLHVFDYQHPQSLLQKRYRFSVSCDSETFSQSDWFDLKVRSWGDANWQRQIPLPEKVREGTHQIEVAVDEEVLDLAENRRLLAHKRIDHAQVLRVLPKGQPSVTRVKCSEESLKPHQPKDGELTVYLNGESPELSGASFEDWFPEFRSMSYCYKLIAIQDGKEVVLGVEQITQSRWYDWQPATPVALRPGKADIIFRPDPEAAKTSVSIEKLVDEEFIVHGAHVVSKPEWDTR